MRIVVVSMCVFLAKNHYVLRSLIFWPFNNVGKGRPVP